jgi:hypothetical protein
LIPISDMACTARAAVRSAWPYVRIRLGELVAALAVRLGCLDGREALAAQDVLAVGGRLKVGRVHAAAVWARWAASAVCILVMAGVVECHTSGDRADEQLVGKPVGKDEPLPLGSPTVDAVSAVADRRDEPGPEPAGAGLVDLSPEAFLKRSFRHVASLAGGLTPGRSRVAGAAFVAILAGQSYFSLQPRQGALMRYPCELAAKLGR